VTTQPDEGAPPPKEQVEPAKEEPVIPLLERVWHDIASLTGNLDDASWNLPTDCPGWSVKDQLSHIIGTERMLLGEAAPPPPDPRPSWVKNDIAAFNEAWVEERRPRSPGQVRDEFLEVTARRLAELRAMPTERFDQVGPSPVGQVPYREFMEVRAFDSFVHEQDIRRAIGRPGGWDGPLADLTVRRVAQGMGYVVGKKVAPAPSTSVVFDLGPFGQITILCEEIQPGAKLKARLATEPVETPAVRLAMDVETFCLLGCGRGDPTALVQKVTLEGDEGLGQRILEEMNFMI
jgi:uncharacterized protein (TIGR03083 family)